MHQVLVRAASPADRELLLPLVRAFAASFIPDEDRFRRSCTRLLDNEDACLLVAEADAPISYLLGFVHDTFYANGPVGWVEEIMVDEAWRRQHIGQQLMRRFEQWATGQGCRLVALATRRAAHFYHALGYEDSATYFRRLLPR